MLEDATASALEGTTTSSTASHMSEPSTTLPPTALVAPMDFSDTGRGLGCKRDVAQGEELLAIPLARCWYGKGAKADCAELAPLMQAKGDLVSDFDAVALQLLIERTKGSASARWDHLQEIPAGYDSTLFWSEAEFEELKGSAWQELARRFTEEADSDWAALQALAGELIEQYAITRLDYLWAYATLKSRAAEAQVDGVPGTRLMAPGFDLFNHSDALRPGSSHYYSDERSELIVVATHAHKAGEQAFISYGHASNGSLLLAGGFVLPSNAFDSVELPLTSLVDASRLNTYMMAAPDAPGTDELASFEFLEVPDDEKIAQSDHGCSPFTTKHKLTMSKPLPLPLLTYVRLDRCGDEELALFTKRVQKESNRQLYEAVREEAPLDALNELLTLSALRQTITSMLDGYTTSLKDDESLLSEMASSEGEAGKARYEAGRSSGDYGAAAPSAATHERKRIALTLRASEKRILHASLDTIASKLDVQLKALLNDAATQAKACLKSGQKWAALLSRRAAILASEQTSARVQRSFERLHSAAGGDGVNAQTTAAFFLLLSDLASHPLAHYTVYAPEAAIFAAADVSEGGSATAPPPPPPSPPLSMALLDSSQSGTAMAPLPYLSLYREKMAFWASYMLAQWGTARALSIDQASLMQQESTSICEQWSYGIPTESALALIGKHAPMKKVVELAAGNGLWSAMLRTRGVHALTFDTKAYDEAYGAADAAGVSAGAEMMGERDKAVQEGGPEVAGSHGDRALLLVWPDYNGQGSYALRCLEHYQGTTLLLVGEWKGRTLAPLAGGRAFSAAFQDAVEASFDRIEEAALPSWPLHLDGLSVWKRKA